ncbi:hypothetical protein N7520_010284 [Penicillium odoratum]|uniref:uncharacterized protein n=1 Tax=Penicillium odoratum TaxID=1167516 RepID=UPI002547CA86|nr:uncharacterized protein N7520_010284 [Penicillium odoratum]KAJ5745102.1 hypothetical protein N7520_010284 [Penicillium odoratum]
MGNVHASTFQRYMNQRVQTHVQAALAYPRKMRRYIDPQAPSHYEDLSLDNPEIVKLKQICDDLAAEAKELYGSMNNAASTKLGELKNKADALLRTTKAN